MEFTFWNNKVDRSTMIQEIPVEPDKPAEEETPATTTDDTTVAPAGPITKPSGFEVTEEEKPPVPVINEATGESEE